MIIDSHVHFGKIGYFDLSESDLIRAMDRYNVDFGIVSNLEGMEFDSELNPIERGLRVSQIEVNARALEFVGRHPDRLKGLFWTKPHTEGFSDEVGEFISRHREHFVGLKAHPYHSKLRFTDARYLPYIEAARENDLVFAVHTAVDEYSRPEYLYQVAEDYPHVDFLMVHMGMLSDHQEAIRYVAELPNLYGDTTWVDEAAVLNAVDVCGSGKVLFGTDAVVAGIDTYAKYADLLAELSTRLAMEDLQNVLWRNAARLFHLDL